MQPESFQQQPIHSPKPPEMDPPFNEVKTSKRDGWKDVIITVGIIVAAPLIALFLTAFVFQSYEVDGQSMETTLQNRDRLIVLKVPRSWAKLTGHAYIPRRGDVVIFTKTGLKEPGSKKEKQLIKRVIALPGERVVVNSGKLTVFNQEHPNGFSPDIASSWSPAIINTAGNLDLLVADGEVFVCGDNRDESLDSRVFGPIDADDIVGKLVFRMLPLGKAKAF